MTNKFLKLLMTVAAFLVPAAAQAQFSTNSNLPAQISADDADYKPGLTILSGQVDVRQGESRVLSDRMNIYTTNSSGQDGTLDGASKIEAIGSFYFLTPEQEVRGDKGVYLKADESFTVTGNVILSQGDGNIVTGETLIYDLKDGSAKVIGSCKGRRCGSKGRVNILLKNTSNNNGNPS